MKKNSVNSTIIPNLYELDELSFLKRETHSWRRFKQKQKFLTILRAITYQSWTFLSKIFLFDIKQNVKDNKLKRQLITITQKDLLNLEQLYQIMNENMQQKQFSSEVDRIKKFQIKVRKYVSSYLQKYFIKYKQNGNLLDFNVYKVQQEYFIKAAFTNYDYRYEVNEVSGRIQIPQPLQITNFLVIKQLNKRYIITLNMAGPLKQYQEVCKLYKNFYDQTYFLYDQFILKLQVFHNYPLLRLKNYVPIKLIDYKTQEPLQGPIFSNADPECLYQHFVGFNINTTRSLEGDYCELCQIQYEQFQQNQILTMLRDNICNPQKCDLFYCPQYNRFKLLDKVKKSQGQNAFQIVLRYTNYYHFRLNLKKITGKNRLTFYPCNNEEKFSLSFDLNNRNIFITDPARGKYCQHFEFTDLRLYYLNFDPQTRLYRCPIKGCEENMLDNDILYLKEVQILLTYARFKNQNCMELLNHSSILINNKENKVSLIYKSKEEPSNNVVQKIDDIPQFYKTLVDPFIPFPDYTLGIKDKQRQEKMNEYMFGGWRQQAQKHIEEQEEEQEEEQDLDD